MVTTIPDREAPPKVSTIAITGANGMVGRRLTQALSGRGDTVCAITRTSSSSSVSANPILWNVDEGLVNPSRLENVDTVVHLAGENIGAGRWTESLKRRIVDSRVNGTRGLVRSFAQVEKRPATLVCASAIGFYGDRGQDEVDENSLKGEGFLADVCSQWEDEAMAAAELGVRVVCVRIGVVLNPAGGALSKMLLPFKLGLGGRIGSGTQYWSWIGLTDLVRVIVHCIDTPLLSGAVNAVSPNPATNAEFTNILGQTLHRPTIFPMPSFAARMALGEMANELLLSSTRVRPGKLIDSGFEFEHEYLDLCLQHELQK